MAKDMENHMELKQKYHMDRLLKAFLAEKKQNKHLEDEIRIFKTEHERAIQRIEKLEHENKQLKFQESDRENQWEDNGEEWGDNGEVWEVNGEEWEDNGQEWEDMLGEIDWKSINFRKTL